MLLIHAHPSSPQWLVFEAEGMLQIRPVQHKCAEHLHNNPGAVLQLNMVRDTEGMDIGKILVLLEIQ